ncbi:hypothetical protein [Paracoccus sp. (in: a-proteobacteria)]|uniref:hypothetical protein n=1 Tax=Paracoccus sp. TaxID=267 RepID=UPI003A83E211
MLSRGRDWATMAITGLAVVAIVGGILVAGGPVQGRAERRDDLRRSDLNMLESQLRCLARERRLLSVEIATTEACPATPSLTDPVTGQPYRIEQIDAENLRLCASFEIPPSRDPARRDGMGHFDDQGCMVMMMQKGDFQPPE